MELCDVLENIDYEVIQYGKKPIDLLGVTIDSRKVKDGFMFVCISGANFDGHDYINSAAELGATAVVCERRDILFPPDITVALVPDTRKALNKLAENFYERAVCRMRVIGVTGTNGKTSTTYLLEASLAEAGIRTGVIGTSGARTNEGKIDIPYATSTTPDTLELHAIFAEMAKRGAEYAVMEVSSHALALDKVIGLNFAAAIFTNLTQDHLDFHGTMENYLEAKSKLFSLCQIGIINNDDPSAEYIKQHATCKIKTFSIKNESDYKAENVILTEAGVSFDLNIGGENKKFSVGIPGRFSVYNALGVVVCALSLGFNAEVIAEGLAKVKNVRGRIQPIQNNKEINVFVDYAHSSDALENIIKTVREFTKGKVITVFGCGGNRDSAKRPIMGKVCGTLSDFCVITSDNPRDEVPEAIIAETEKGIMETNCEYIKITDRREAIFEAIRRAAAGDAVIIAGKGAEDYQEFENGRRVFFDDAQTAQEALS